MKNIDKIRKMSDHTLAILLQDFRCKHCACYRDECSNKQYGACLKEVKIWLEKEI